MSHPPPASASRFRLVTALCLVTIVLAVLDSNIVSAAAVPLVRDLDPEGGLAKVPWLVTAFQLAATAALPLYGKLCDTLGAKRVFLGALGIFLLGSALCGFARSMPQLLAFRALQGVGGGGLMSITLVVIRLASQARKEAEPAGAAEAVGPLGAAGPPGAAATPGAAVPPEAAGTTGGTEPQETARAPEPPAAPKSLATPEPPATPGAAKTSSPSRGAGAGGLVAGAGMALGPWVGGMLTEHLSWRWIFWVNLPVGLAVLLTAAAVLRLPDRPERRRVDYAGAALAAAFASAFLLTLEWGGGRWPWLAPQTLALAATALALLVLFLWRQATAPEPVLPLTLFGSRALRLGFAVQLLLGIGLTSAIVQVMLYLQVARGLDSASAGLFLLPMAAGMTVSGVLSQRYVNQRARLPLALGTSGAALGLALLATSTTHTSAWATRGALFVLGCGFGLLVGQLVQYAQDSAPAGLLGVTTTAARFFQTLGGAAGAALSGVLLTRLTGLDGAAARGHDPSTTVPGAALSFTGGIDTVFACLAALMLLATALVLRLPVPRTAPAGTPPGTPEPPPGRRDRAGARERVN
ncbi:MFS transporter [Streptomyces sp. NPDC060243]|uniref:MFS transporter n=1 Tax=Streptomyces sp. NPDC060243 TaxID=3347081 RepID=UPI00364DF09F